MQRKNEMTSCLYKWGVVFNALFGRGENRVDENKKRMNGNKWEIKWKLKVFG